MSRRYIDDHQILSKYLGDELSEQERTEFEAYWAEHPEIIEELEVDARLESGFTHLQKSGKLAGLIDAGAARRSGWPIALAASLIAGVGIAVWLVGERAARPVVLAASIAALNAPDVGSSPVQAVELLPARSTLYDAVIELPRTATVLELHVLAEGLPKSAQYGISLHKIRGTGERDELSAVSGLRPDADGFLTVYADSAHLVAAQYELRIRGEAPASPARSFLIKVNPTAGK